MGVLTGITTCHIFYFLHFCTSFLSHFDIVSCKLPDNGDRNIVLGAMLPTYYLDVRERPDDNTKKIWLPPGRHYPYHLQMAVPALSIAVKKAQEQILPGWNLSLQTMDSMCDSDMTQFTSADLHVDFRVHAYIGPVCEYPVKPAERFAIRWKIPLITTGAQSVNYRTSPIITNFMPPHSHLGSFIAKFWHKYQWTRGVLLYHNNDRGAQDTFFMAGGIYSTLNVLGLNFTHHSFDEFNYKDIDYEELLLKYLVPESSGKSHMQIIYILYSMYHHNKVNTVEINSRAKRKKSTGTQ